MPFFTEHTDTRYITAGTYRSDVSSEGGTAEQSEVEQIGRDSHRKGHSLQDRKHRSHIRYVVYESGDKDGTPDHYGIEQKYVCTSHRSYDACQIIYYPHFGDPRYHGKETCQKEQRIVIKILQYSYDTIAVPVL